MEWRRVARPGFGFVCSRLLRAFRRNSTTESEVGFARWCAITSALRFASRWRDPRPSTRSDNLSRKIDTLRKFRSRRVERFPRACSAPTSKGHASKGAPFGTSCRPSSTKRTSSKRRSTPASRPAARAWPERPPGSTAGSATVTCSYLRRCRKGLAMNAPPG